jgi:outer membrane cobalamin receptor
MKKIVLAAFAMAAALPTMAEQGVALADTSRVYDLDEVVVVSQNKEFMKLRQQPVSSTVLTGTELFSLGSRDLRDIANFVPSFVMPDYGARFTSSIYVRGIGSRVNSPSMGIYIDDVPLVNKSMFNSHVYELDRVDVLRGPQGTLYGINTEGGLVRQYTKNPMNYQGTNINLGIGSLFYRKAEVAHYQKLSDKVAFSVAAFYDGTN